MELSEEEKILVFSSLLHDIGKPAARMSNENHWNIGAKVWDSLTNFQKFVNNKDEVKRLILSHHSGREVEGVNKELLGFLRSADNLEASGRDAEQDRKGIALKINEEEENKKISCIKKIDYVMKLNNPVKGGTKDENRLYSETISSLKSIYDKDLYNFLEKAKTVIKMNYFFIPSQEIGKINGQYSEVNTAISLYTHLMSVTAIALSEYRWKKENGQGNKFLIISGDMSGIQKFIFNRIKNEGTDKLASKRLRGRSFLVNMLTYLISRKICNELNLPPMNILTLSSSKFIILAPNTKKTIEKLNELKTKLTNEIWSKYKPLYLNLNWISMDEHDKLNEKFKELNNITLKNKYKELINSISYTDEKINTKGKICEFCGVHFTEEKSEMPKCKFCQLEEEIGKNIAEGNIIISITNAEKEPNIELLNEKISIQFSNKLEPDAVNILLFNKATAEKASDVHQISHLMYINNYVYKNKANVPATFNELGEKSSNGESILLSIAKFDIDNLGLTFRGTMNQSDNTGGGTFSKSIAQMQLFSELVNLFVAFDAYEAFKDKKVYVVFAGGDDFTFILSPKEVIENGAINDFIKEFYKKFVSEFEYEHNSTKITLSGGVTFFKEKFPMSRAINIAEELLENSKNNGKNKITYIEPVKNATLITKNVYSKEDFDNKKLVETVSKLIEIYRSDKLKYSTIMKLKKIREENIFNVKNEFIIPKPFIKYTISRNTKDQETFEEIENFFLENWTNVDLIIRLFQIWKNMEAIKDG